MKRYVRKVIPYMETIIEGRFITKEKRQEMFGKVAGGAGSTGPENYQRAKIVEVTGIPCPKTKMRINLRTNQMKVVTQPNMCQDGFDYSEDFDGVQAVNGKLVYINMKCIADSGGNQDRSLREVYWFMQGQLNCIKPDENIYFANILDGDRAHKHIDKYAYLINLIGDDVKKTRIYVGDLLGYLSWFQNLKDGIQ